MHSPYQDDAQHSSPGNPNHFDYLFNRLYPTLVQFAKRFVQDKQVAEDIVTETFLKLWVRQANFISPQSAKSFLYISTRNACFNYLEQAKYHGRVKEILQHILDDHQESIDKEITRSEVKRMVFHLVSELPSQCRKVLLLYYLKGLTNQQIADKLGLSTNTVRNHKVRALKMVREKLKSMMW
jgi:RNA polymerase sigma-70 factor (family 1)